MSSLVDAVMNEIGSSEIEAVAQRFGLSPDHAQQAIAQTLPLMVGALARNASTPGGADALHSALADHTQSDIGGLLGGLLGGSNGGGLGSLAEAVLGGGRSGAGAASGGLAEGIGGAILGHVFGNRRPQAEQGLGQATGIGGANAGQLMAMLAPIVMAVLARMNQQRQLGPGGLSDVLGRDAERSRAGGGLTGGLLGAVLDRDGDGDVDLSDLLNVGGGLLGGLRR